MIDKDPEHMWNTPNIKKDLELIAKKKKINSM